MMLSTSHIVHGEGSNDDITMFLFEPYWYSIEMITSAIVLRLKYGK